MREVSHILRWAEDNRSIISAVHIPGVENWAADFLSRQGLASGEWELHPEIFQQICLHWGTPDVDLMASRLNAKVTNFIACSRDPQAIGVDALISPWHRFHFLYVFPPLPLLPKVIRKIKLEGVPLILVAPNWPRRRETPFHFTLPKEGDLIQPISSVTPPMIGQLKRGPRRHSTPIVVGGCPDSTLATSDVTAESNAASNDVTVESAMVTTDVSEESDKGNSGSASDVDGKLCLRMKLITPVNEESQSAPQFSLEKPPVAERTNGAAAVEGGIASSTEDSPSVFIRVCEVHREEESRSLQMPTTPVSKHPLPIHMSHPTPNRQENFCKKS
ncbi:unnamed protein product [Ranitomeya imitator]|uniref:Uncharacterized protein n=1 Tax=Ranitomeya imitator TaxID=111125 RepID=A0ABN9LSG7_9NEOB|nr:unnamed protein product [Ranitomeya imitator]